MSAASVFEAGMLICFGISWPASIWKVWRSKTSAGKSFLFLWMILSGYICGTMFKILGNTDWVTALYILNGCNVSIDLALSYRYRPRLTESALESYRRQ